MNLYISKENRVLDLQFLILPPNCGLSNVLSKISMFRCTTSIHSNMNKSKMIETHAHVCMFSCTCNGELMNAPKPTFRTMRNLKSRYRVLTLHIPMQIYAKGVPRRFFSCSYLNFSSWFIRHTCEKMCKHFSRPSPSLLLNAV